VWRDNIFKPTIGYESLHQDSNDNGFRIVNCATSKNVIVKSATFPHQNIHKYAWISPVVKTHNQIDHILIDGRWHLSILDVWSFRGADYDTYHYLAVAKLRERLAVNKQTAQMFDGERFNLRKLNELKVRKQYQIEITPTYACIFNIVSFLQSPRPKGSIKLSSPPYMPHAPPILSSLIGSL